MGQKISASGCKPAASPRSSNILSGSDAILRLQRVTLCEETCKLTHEKNKKTCELTHGLYTNACIMRNKNVNMSES